MEKIKLYIFTQDNYRGASYGIGTYLNQLIDWLKLRKDVELALIHLFSQEKTLKIEENGNYKQIYIPSVKKAQLVPDKVFENRYFRNTVYFLKEMIPDNPANIFHFQFMSQRELVSWMKKMFSGKIVLTVHYTDWSFNLLGDKKRLERILLQSVDELENSTDKIVADGIKQDKKIVRLCDQVICIAQHSYRSIKEITDIEENRICIITNGIKDTYRSLPEAKRNLLRKKYRIADSQKIILFAGRLDEVKGIAYLIKSFEKLLATHPETRLVMVGEGDFDKWFSLIKNCWTQITFTGKLTKKQLYDWYKIADIGVSCSIHEEFGLVAVEMMMHELPIIVTDTGGLAEIIDDKVTGLKVPVKKVSDKSGVNVNILVKQLQFLLDHSESAIQIGKNARKRFLEKYQLTHFKNNMLNFYNNLDNGKENTKNYPSDLGRN